MDGQNLQLFPGDSAAVTSEMLGHRTAEANTLQAGGGPNSPAGPTGNHFTI